MMARHLIILFFFFPSSFTLAAPSPFLDMLDSFESPKLTRDYLDSIKENYCDDGEIRQAFLTKVKVAIEANLLNLKVGSQATYKIIEENDVIFGWKSHSLTGKEVWTVVSKNESGVKISIKKQDGKMDEKWLTKDSELPKAFIDKKRPLTCLLSDTFFGNNQEFSYRLEGHSYPAYSYFSEALGGPERTTVIALGIPFSHAKTTTYASKKSDKPNIIKEIENYRW